MYACMQVSPAKAPQVVGGLLDAEAPDEFVNNLILSVRSLIPVEALCAEVRWPASMAILLPLLKALAERRGPCRKGALPLRHGGVSVSCARCRLQLQVARHGVSQSLLIARISVGKGTSRRMPALSC